MLLVVDANIVFSSLIAGNIIDLFLSEKLQLIAPELLFVEMRKHKEDIKAKSHFSEQEFEIILSVLEKRIKIIPLQEFIMNMTKAEQLLKEHVKDAPYIALALRYNCAVWSYEKLFKNISGIQSLTTKEIAEIIRNY
ncbi:hypothetical protein HYY69_02780 [Candidatus Woesearchaeota archaeon]|nr:hypothetical protein [Candidatus Woesearchaeota archaeon]